jgi:tetratricopeptide (TPR) repeat protein
LVCIYLGLGLLTLAVFGLTVRYSFLDYDDDAYVLANPHVLTGLTWQNVGWAFGSTHASNWHPLTWLSHALDCQLYGRWAGGHHLTNVLFHLTNTLLLFGLLQRMTGALWRSAFVAGLFAVHPLHVESVAWIAERKDVLSAFFFLLTLWAYVRYVERSEVGGRRSEGTGPWSVVRGPWSFCRLPSSVFYLLSVGCFTLGLMSKPMVVTLPFLLLLLDYWPLRRFPFSARRPEIPRSRGKGRMSRVPVPASTLNPRPSTLPRLLAEKLPFLALAAASCLATVFAQKKGGAMLSLGEFPFRLRLANALVSYARYLGKALWPQQLAPFYPHPVQWPDWQVAGAGILLACASISVIVLARRAPYLFTGWFWFLGMLIPVIGLVQVGSQAMADRYMYLPGIGLFLAVAWGVPVLVPAGTRRGRILRAASLLVVAACSVCAAMQVRYWKDSEALFTHAIQVTRDNCVAYNNLGKALAQQERLDEAVQAFSESLQIRPDFAHAHANLGGALRRQGKLEAAAAHFETALFFHPEDAQVQNDLGNVLDALGRPDAAMPHYLLALQVNPDLASAHYNLAGTLAARGQADEAVSHFEAAIRLEPKNASAHYNLGYTLAKLGCLKEAEAEYLAALELNPDHASARNNLGNLLIRMGKPSQAIPQFEAVLAKKPDLAEAHYGLSKALLAEGKTEQALPHLREAVRLKPNLLPALNDLAWLLATHPRADLRDGPQAVQLAERLCEMTGRRQPAHLATLAAAYGETGQYAQAGSIARAAYDLAVASGNTEQAAALRRQIELYGSNQAFREPPSN